MTMKKCISLVLCLVLLLSLVACGRNKGEETQAEVITQLPPIETAPQKHYTQDQIREMYNLAIDKLVTAKSYHMYGSSNSLSAFGDVVSSVVNGYDLKCQRQGDNTIGFFDSTQKSDSIDFAHTTYHDGENYYYSIANLKYYKNSNDYQDFYATDYLKKIGDVELQELKSTDLMDGSVEIGFAVPMGEYNSDAVLSLIGITSETIDQDLIHLNVTLDPNGYMTYFYISFTSNMTFLSEDTEQTIIVGMYLDGYDGVTVEPPVDMNTYENWIEETVPGEDHQGVGILSPEDVD